MSTAIPLPNHADPQTADEWQVDRTGDSPTYRCVWSTPFSEDHNIRVVGVQWTDGSLCTEGPDAPSVYMDHEPLPTNEARALAAALNAAADLADQWSEVPR
jgi:hypothetical protein